MAHIRTLLYRAVRLLLSIIYTLVTIVGIIALALVLAVLFVLAMFAFFLFALAVQEYRAHIVIGGIVCFFLFAVWFLRTDRGTTTDKEVP
ncbi:MAG: hypothetical protein RL681_257 [Candidatus Parcubacteria bacterium]|jgi:phosphate starvation-inducible membrane PsiE